MRLFSKTYKSISRRALSVILAIAVFLSMILAVVSGVIFVSIAGNPSKVGALNQTSTVQQINLMPVDPNAADSRTTLNAGTNTKESYLYSTITVNTDDSIDFTITKDTTHNVTSINNTAFVESFTLINQRINLAENPWLMTRWSGSGRVNGRVYFTVTKNGVEYGPDNVVIGTKTVSGKTVSNLSTWTQQELLKNNSTTGKMNVFSIPLSNIINNNNAGYSYTNQTQTDFNASSVQDFSIDFYEYVNTQVSKGAISLSPEHWPTGDEWKDSSKNYVTIYMSCQIIASEAGQPLTAGTNVHWEQFALGREVLDRPASMLPRTAEFMNITDTSGTNGVDYGRVSASADGSVTFSNTSSSESVMFGWNLRRYFNATELESLHVEATFTNMTVDDLNLKTWFGGRTTTYVKTATLDQTGAYNYRGAETSLSDFLKSYARSKEATANNLSAVIDFHTFATNDGLNDNAGTYPSEYFCFYPDDSLIYIGDIKLVLPKGAKITFTRLEFQVENEEIPATLSNTAYPWYSNVAPEGLPPIGTPTYSTTLNGDGGRCYDWVTAPEKAPVVETKVDLLAMKTYSYKKWDGTVIHTSSDDDVGVPYNRYSNGSSVYSSANQSENTYYTIMRFGESSDWSRNYYTYIDVTDTPYLYYSYELVDKNPDDGVDPMAGFYFHIANAGRDKYSYTDESGNAVSAYCYQYYLDHSGIALNECSSVYSLGNASGAYEYGAKAILSTSTARTGCIDFSSLWVDGISNKSSVSNGNYLKLEAMRIYLSPNTEIKINYFFIGSESLADSVAQNTYATQGGEAYPWATTKEQFDAATDPDSATSVMTFANKVDVLADIQDRVQVHNEIVDDNIAANKVDPGTKHATVFPGATVDPETGAVTLTVTDTSNVNTGYYKTAGVGFDHIWRVQVAEDNDLSTLRYLNYSVDAASGMRWSLMLCEATNNTQQRAIMTWCDADACWNDDSLDTSAPAGKSYFRIATSGKYEFSDSALKTEYENFWQNQNNTSWRIYSVPGSQTGCIDLQQVSADFDLKNIVSIYLVAYKDPNLVLTDQETASVTFNYVYLTSEPIQKSDVGKPSTAAGTIYNWGNTKVSAPSVNKKTEFVYGTPTDLSVGADTTFVDYFPHGMVDFLKFEESDIKLNETANDGKVSINANNTVTISAEKEFAFSVEYSNPIPFDLSTLNTLYTGISSEKPFRIAMFVSDGTTNSAGNSNGVWIYTTSSSFGSTFPSYTVGTDVYADAGSYNAYLSFADKFNFADKSNVTVKTFSVRFLGGTITNSNGTTRASTLSISSLQACNVNVDLQDTPYLYYSYRLIDTETGKTVTTVSNGDGSTSMLPLRVGMSIIENNKYYYIRNTGGSDSNSGTGSNTTDSNLGVYLGTNRGFGKPSFIRLSTSSDEALQTAKGHDSKYYRVYGAETGCINLSEYFTDKDTSARLNRLRFYIDSSYYTSDRYQFVVDYLFLGSAPTSSTSFSKYHMPSKAKAPSLVDMQQNIVEHETFVGVGSMDLSPVIEIDLDKTPYLFYSINYNGNGKGTFGLVTDVSIDGSSIIYRNVGLNDGTLISSYIPNQYLQQSETGCVDVQSWYRNHGYNGNILRVSALELLGDSATFNYLFFGGKADKTIDLIPEEASGVLNNSLPTRTWVVPSDVSNYAEVIPDGDDADQWDDYNETTNPGKALPTTAVGFKTDITDDGFNDLWLQSSQWSQIYLRYGNIINNGSAGTFQYLSTGNNQTSGLTIDLDETPYLHFSFEQPDDSGTTMILQLNNYTATSELLGESANKVKPWLSAYSPTSPAGQLIMVVAEEKVISYYKDIDDSETPVITGNFGGVIDLRSWYTVTNGCDNVISLESIRLYTYGSAKDGSFNGTDLKVNHLYLSSSSSAAYSVTFHKNDGTDTSYTQYVLKNANAQFVSDAAVESYKARDGFTFVGWYLDPECETYFDITDTALTGNIDLYARWIDNNTIISGDNIKEVNILSEMSKSEMTVEYNTDTPEEDKLIVEEGKDALTITNDTKNSCEITFPIGIAYSVGDLRSLFMGFDTDVTCKAYNEPLSDGKTIDPQKQGFDILLNAKSSTARSYSLVQDAFAADYLTASKLLTAAPHDGESAFYTYLGIRDDLPVRENAKELIEVKSVVVVIPAGLSVDFRYIKAGNEMSLLGNTDVRAPHASSSTTFDLLANTDNSDSFVSKSADIVYNELKSKSYTYKNNPYTQVAIHGREDGYAHLGGLYSCTIDMTDTSKTNPGKWLYFSIDQSADSHFTFALYASFSGMIEGKTQGKITDPVYDIFTTKSVSYYDAASGKLVAKSLDENAETFIPVETAYINGSKVGWINLYAWYEDALKPYRENSQVESVEILGLRLFTDERSTDTVINYMFLGGDEAADSVAHFDCWVEYPYYKGSGLATTGPKDSNGATTEWRENVDSDPFYMLGNSSKGETFYVTLDQLSTLKDDAPIDDPSKVFLGWVFRDYAVYYLTQKYIAEGLSATDAEAKAKQVKPDRDLVEYLIWWNPNAENGDMYDPATNPGGSWSMKHYEGFVQNQRSVFYTFSTSHWPVNTQIIVPIFADADYTPSVTATVDGDGTVTMVSSDASAVEGKSDTWTAPYASEIVLRANGTDFAGWYDQNGVLISLSKDYHVTLVSDTTVTARFATEDSSTNLERFLQGGRSIVWLQSENGTAGTSFYLQSVNGGDIVLSDGETPVTVQKSNINDVSGNTQIACYWNIANAQLLKAVAPSGYHWEQLLSDGSGIRVSAGNEYVFIASTNIKLVAVADSGSFTTSVIIDEYAFDDDRTDPFLRFNGQVICGANEELISCGLVFRNYKDHGEMPAIDCAASDTVTATAWNSTTGQFVVEFSIENSPEYLIRGYAILYNTQTEQYVVRYSQCLATVF